MPRVVLIGIVAGLSLTAAEPPQKPSPFGRRKELPTAQSTSRNSADKKSAGSADRTAARTAPAEPYTGETVQTGIATFYGDAEHGRQTSSGEAFDNQKLTAAHPSFPFGSRVHVTNLASGKSIDVIVTDRGRFSGQRVISVSKRAAEELGFVAAGTARVKIELLQ